jgi:hypothetical protein
LSNKERGWRHWEVETKEETIGMKGLRDCWNNSMLYPMKLKGLTNWNWSWKF